MKIYPLHTGLFKLDGGSMFGVVPKSIWSKTNPADSNNLCDWAARLMLIENGKQLILIDTGLGNKQDEKFFRHYYRHETLALETALHSLGFHTDEVTDVLLTHLHFDHVGGAIQLHRDNYVPTFKNATYWSCKEHWDWALNPNPREKASFLDENILPIQESEQLKFIPNQDGFQFAENIQIRFANGHTESMMLPQIQYKGKEILFMADLLPSVGHIPLPYVMSYDIRPLQTMKERDFFWKEAVENDYILFLEHDAYNECCTLQHTEKGIRLKDTFKLGEYI